MLASAVLHIVVCTPELNDPIPIISRLLTVENAPNTVVVYLIPDVQQTRDPHLIVIVGHLAANGDETRPFKSGYRDCPTQLIIDVHAPLKTTDMLNPVVMD